MLFGPVVATAQTAKIVPVPPDRNPDLYVQKNVNVTGARATFPGRPTWVDPTTGQTPDVNRIYNNGQIGRQENEVSCGVNPLNDLNILCAYNWYGFADRPEQGDAWIGFSEAIDGHTFVRRPLPGYKAHINPLNKEFAADPTMMVFPGGAIVTYIAGDRNGNSVLVAQRMMEVNREFGFRHISENRALIIESLGGVHFIDKPDAQIIIDPAGGTTPVTMSLEEPIDCDNNPDTPPVFECTRDWPKFRIVASFADFGGSGENIRTWSTYSDDFGVTWSNKRQISNTSGLDQGLSIEDKGDDLLYVFRRFDSGENRASIMGALSTDRGERIGKVFEITDICDFDMFTSPNPDNSTRSSARSNAFPWLSATDTHFVLAYAERPRDGTDRQSDGLHGVSGNCLPAVSTSTETGYIDNPPDDTTLFDGVAGTRIMIRTSTDGKNWSEPVPVTPFNTNRPPWNTEELNPPAVHFEFMPTVACGRGSCNVIFYSTLTESETYEFLHAEGTEKHWEKTGFVEDFNVGEDLWYRRFLDIFSSKITIVNSGGNSPGKPQVSDFPERVSRYQIDFDESGEAFEKRWNPANILNYGGNTVPFIGDYIALATAEWRKDGDTWVNNASPVTGSNIIGINDPSYFAAWTDNRRVHVFYDETGSPLDYALPSGTIMVENDEDATKQDPLEGPDPVYVAEESNLNEQSKVAPPAAPMNEKAVTGKQPDGVPSAHDVRAENEADDNDPSKVVGLCSYDSDSAEAGVASKVQTRIKDAEIYGATIEDLSSVQELVRLVSPAAAKNYTYVTTDEFGDEVEVVIQRGFVIGAQNLSSTEERPLALVIENQPAGGRASWRQLPFDPSQFPDNDPDPQEEVLAERLSTEYLTLFVVADGNEDVTVSAYDYDPATDTRGSTVLAQITVNGESESGDLQGPALSAEVHNPFLVEPVWADLEVVTQNPNWKNSDINNPNWKNPNWKNTDYMDPNWKNPNWKNESLTNTTVEATNLKSSNLKNPNWKNTPEFNAAFVDVTYQVVSLNNTTTATNADFAYGGDETDGLDVEVIAWQSYELDSQQNCDPESDPGIMTETQVISAKSINNPNWKNPNWKNPNWKNLAPADVNDPFQGLVSFPLSPGGVVNTTIRIYGPHLLLQKLIDQDIENPNYNPEAPQCLDGDPTNDDLVCEEFVSKLQAKLGYNIWAQKANTEKCKIGVPIKDCQINTNQEQQIKDVIPPSFNFPNDHVFVAEADSSSGATINLETGDGIGGVGIAAFDEKTSVDVACSLLTDPAQGMPATAPLGQTTDAECKSDADASGNIGIWTGFVRVVDTTEPSITAPADITDLEATGLTTAVSADDCSAGRLGFPTVDDLTGTPTYDCGAPLSLSLGANAVTWTADDGNGNTATDTQTVTVVDTTPPGITAPASTSISATGMSTEVLDCADLGTPIVDDVTGIPTYDCGAPLSLGLGQNTVTWTATDASGNFATATQTVTVVDLTPPDITAPADISAFEANADPTHISDCSVLGTPTVSDQAGTPTSDCDAPTLDFLLGPNTVTWTADDGNGNTATDTQTVTIVDTTDPVITVPNSITEMATSLSGKTVKFAVIAQDIFKPVTISCVDEHGTSIPSIGGDLFQGDFGVGSTEVECTATDPNGNPLTPPSATATGTFVVTIEFQYGTWEPPISAAKPNARTGTSIPVYFAWTVDDVPVHVDGIQVMQVKVGACPGTVDAKTPGNSGFQELPDFSWQWNFQAVDENGDDLPAETTGTPYCLTATLTNSLVPEGQSQSGTIILKNNQ
jgi:hypothetical protein